MARRLRQADKKRYSYLRKGWRVEPLLKKTHQRAAGDLLQALAEVTRLHDFMHIPEKTAIMCHKANLPKTRDIQEVKPLRLSLPSPSSEVLHTGPRMPALPARRLDRPGASGACADGRIHRGTVNGKQETGRRQELDKIYRFRRLILEGSSRNVPCTQAAVAN
jgi:hypothetical protein